MNQLTSFRLQQTSANKTNYYLRNTGVFIALLSIILIGCEKQIDIDLPEAKPQLVIEGKIEYDGIKKTPPYVILTKSEGFFEPTSIAAIEEAFVHNAQVTVTVDNVSYNLPEICLSDLLPLIALDSSLAEVVAEFVGTSVANLGGFEYCIYTVLDTTSSDYVYGEAGKTYVLTVVSEGETYTSTTVIPPLVPLDSIWYLPQLDDTLGFVWAHLVDPGGVYNAYRWFAKRISHDYLGNPKDDYFVAPFGSSFEDKFIDGQSFDFAYDRGHPPGDHSEVDPSEVPHYFKPQDTIVIKFCTIGADIYKFLRVYEIEINSSGSPFASPSTIPTNIEGGGLGLWAGYGVTYDTIYGY